MEPAPGYSRCSTDISKQFLTRAAAIDHCVIAMGDSVLAAVQGLVVWVRLSLTKDFTPGIVFIIRI
jgi:hypothetical protein